MSLTDACDSETKHGVEKVLMQVLQTVGSTAVAKVPIAVILSPQDVSNNALRARFGGAESLCENAWRSC